ncbi:MFS transporter [Actinomycetospora termitidis]|uniref:MFS transporter n=1 Tax=Actinomycetospora termitidis TaxID=3053470 RepID=A0ABT7M7L0_9PSEU|nr:MFS transporter [Actinomycetospora sp. Odt1-22]MDL5156012.1 MFS transporter [Actinomycetospora sp. Odt1-22]
MTTTEKGVLRRWSIVSRLGELPAPMRLIVLGQLAFNLGFYLVLPFFAVHLGRDLGLSGAAIGLLLGLRTFSQQGLFAVGGALADRYGTKQVAVIGFVIRIAGFVLLALADGLPLLVLGTVAVGFAAALFSPAVEAELARQAADSTIPRADVFAMFAVCGQIGIVVGPVLGSALLAVDFAVTTLTAAAVFVVVLITFVVVMPREPGAHAADPVFAGWREVVRDRTFLAFAAAYSTWLLSYNQLYLLLPVELGRVDAVGALGAMFVLSAVLVILAQLPFAALARRLGPRRALPGGFAVLAMAFGLTAVLTAFPGITQHADRGWWRLLPAALFVVLLTLGQMTVVPLAQDAVGRLAGERRLGSYFGVLATAGGVVVLLGGIALGALVDPALPPALPWAATAVLPALSALALFVLTRRTPALTTEGTSA